MINLINRFGVLGHEDNAQSTQLVVGLRTK